MTNKPKSLADLAAQATKASVSKEGNSGEKKLDCFELAMDDVVSKLQVRKRFRNIEELAQSIQLKGLDNPITVTEKNSDGKYVIQVGERRWRAYKLLNAKTIPAFIKAKPENEQDEVVFELIENIQRDDLSPMEIAEGIGKLVKSGLSYNQISEKIGKPKTYISRHYGLLSLPDIVLDLYNNEIVSDPETLISLKNIYDLNSELCKVTCSDAIANKGISRSSVAKILKSQKNKDNTESHPDNKVEQGASKQSPKSKSLKGNNKIEIQILLKNGDDKPIKAKLCTSKISNTSGKAWVLLSPDNIEKEVNCAEIIAIEQVVLGS